ncbi:MAG: TVP38/TMEM64 family protein [Oscillatoriales cyanobacterium SM2_2_1]|nr:TVP38/TMEM64 family protein [Oscillatoriales cyanobacterium SM2_2_1]
MKKLLALAATALLLGLALWIWGRELQEVLRQALLVIQGAGWAGIALYVLIYNVATVLLIPGSLLTLGGGLIYGVVAGSAIVFGAATLGATWAFLIGRYLSRDWVQARLAGNEGFGRISRAVAREGLKIVFLSRLSPVFPFNVLNYAFGLTEVSLRDYVLGSLGMVPGTILYVYLGSLVGDVARLGKVQELSQGEDWVGVLVKVLGFGATLAVTTYVTVIARRALQEEVE